MSSTTHGEVVLLDGETLSIEMLYALGDGTHRIDLTAEAWERVGASRAVVEMVLSSGQVWRDPTAPCELHDSVIRYERSRKEIERSRVLIWGCLACPIDAISLSLALVRSRMASTLASVSSPIPSLPVTSCNSYKRTSFARMRLVTVSLYHSLEYAFDTMMIPARSSRERLMPTMDCAAGAAVVRAAHQRTRQRLQRYLARDLGANDRRMEHVADATSTDQGIVHRGDYS